MTEDPKARCDRSKAIRRAHRGVITKLTKEVDELLSEETTSEEVQARLRVILRQLEAKQSLLNDLDREILSLCELADVDGEIDESETITAKIIQFKGKLETALQRFRPATGVTEVTALPDSASISPLPVYSAKARLPKLMLPKFRGDVTAWTTFWDSFKAAVHDNTELTKIDKFNYLTSLLEGAAAHSIQGLTLSGANYDNAVELLKQRFGRPQQIITAHMDALLKVQGCFGDRPATLRFVYDRINVDIRGLNLLGVCSDQYGSLLIPVIMSKLPNDIRLRIARETTSEVWKMDELLG